MIAVDRIGQLPVFAIIHDLTFYGRSASNFKLSANK